MLHAMLKSKENKVDPVAQLIHRKYVLRKKKEEEERKSRPAGFDSEKILVKEVDFLENDENDRITLGGDIYQVCIGALLSKEINPTWEMMCVRSAFTSYILQMSVLMGLFYDYSSMRNIQPMNIGSTFLRFISTMILHEQIFIEL